MVIVLAALALASVAAMISTKRKINPPTLGSDFVGTAQAKQSGGVVVPDLQENPSIPIPEGSKTTVAVIASDQIIRTDIVSKQQLNQNALKPKIKTVFNNPRSGGLTPQAGQIKTSANISGSFEFGLSADQLGIIQAQPFTEQEIKDIEALRIRRNSKTSAVRKLKDKPEVVIQKKRAQEAIAKGVFNSASVQNPNFALGLPSTATIDDIELAIRQRQSQDAIHVKIAENQALAEQRITTGNQIIDTIKKSGFNQKQFLLNQGIALRGQDLNAKAIAKLNERFGIVS